MVRGNSIEHTDVAMMAVGLQLAVEISRHLNMAIRWTASFENEMVSVQRLLHYADLKPESLET